MAERSFCAEQVSRQDPDRYVTALFAPAERRSDLFALYAFNAEVARTREVVSEPMLGHIRLQWWRDAIAECYGGRPRQHQVVEVLASAIYRHDLPRALFDRLLDARAMDFADAPPESLERLEAYADATSGDLTRLALYVLGVTDETTQEAGGLVGTAWALTGLMRALPHQLRQGRIALPGDVMHRHGVVERDLRELKPSDAVRKAVEEICRVATGKLERSRSIMSGRAGKALPALLPGALAMGYLARLSHLGHDPFHHRNERPLALRSWRLMVLALAGRY